MPTSNDSDALASTGHDIHFLSRLDRVSLPHVELSLALYRDPKLVRYVLNAARVAEGATRVAISLDHPKEGPFLIVTREGHFVTCLGEGMAVDDIPIITRGQLDGLSEKIEDLRNRMEVAKRLTGGGETTRLLRRVLTGGTTLTREEFIGISAWQPLMRREFLTQLFGTGAHLLDLKALLRSVKKPKPRDEPLLLELWNTYFAVGHLCLLVAMDGREFIESLPPHIAEVKKHISWMAVRQGNMALALKGAWAVGKLGKAALPAYKERYAEAQTSLQLINTAMGLSAIGMRHSRFRAEVIKTLTRLPLFMIASEVPRCTPLAELFVAILESMPEMNDFSQVPSSDVGAAAFLFMNRQAASGGDPSLKTLQDVPAPLALTALLNCPFDFINGVRGISEMLLALPWAARAEPEDFYFPKQILDVIRPRWSPADTFAILATERKYYGASVPLKAKETQPRNAPCACGSGKKYKKCCGGSGGNQEKDEE